MIELVRREGKWARTTKICTNKLPLYSRFLEGYKYLESSSKSSGWPGAKRYSPTGKVPGIQVEMVLCDLGDWSLVLVDNWEAIKLGRL